MLDYDLESLLVELELCATIALPCGKESNHLMGGLYVGFEGFTEKLGKSKALYYFCEILHIKSNHVYWSNEQ